MGVFPCATPKVYDSAMAGPAIERDLLFIIRAVLIKYLEVLNRTSFYLEAIAAT
jgi:hypothetical protein